MGCTAAMVFTGEFYLVLQTNGNLGWETLYFTKRGRGRNTINTTHLISYYSIGKVRDGKEFIPFDNETALLLDCFIFIAFPPLLPTRIAPR